MLPIAATEKKPSRVCNDPSAARSWIDVWADTDSTRDCGAGSAAVWNGASAQVQLVETIVAAPISAVKSKAKLSISPISIGSNGVAKRIAEFLIGLQADRLRWETTLTLSTRAIPAVSSARRRPSWLLAFKAEAAPLCAKTSIESGH